MNKPFISYDPSLTIWKVPIKPTDEQTISLPKDAVILTIQIQNENPYLWALVNPAAELENRYIQIFGTGYPINYDTPISRKYITTFQMANGQIVFHAFELLK